MFRLLWQELRFRRNGIIGWGLGVSIYAASYLSFYPSMGEQLASFDMENMPIYEAMNITDMTTFAGYLAGTIVNLAPILVAIYAILNGSGTLAGEEDDGRLELVVTLPVPRWQVVAAKALATAIALLLVLTLLGVAIAGTLLAIERQIETGLTVSAVFMSAIYMWPLVLAVAMLALFFGAYLPNRRTAALATTVIFVVGYFGAGLSNLYSSLDPVRFLFLFSYYEPTVRIFTEGPDVGNMVVLLGLSLAFFLLAVWAFQRRNITVGAWPWQRARVQ